MRLRRRIQRSPQPALIRRAISHRQVVHRHYFARPSMKSPSSKADLTVYGINFTEGEPSDELIKMLFPNYPNQQQITIYAALGQAIAAWQLVD